VVYALARVFAVVTGQPALRVDVLRHGRDEAIGTGIDLARTTGWFTATVPVHCTVRTGLPAFAAQPPAPHGGVGYGALRYSGDHPGLRALPPAEVCLDYVGSGAPDRTGGLLRALPDADAGPVVHPGWQRPYPLEVQCLRAGDRMTIDWIYGRRLFARGTVEAWAAAHEAEVTALVKSTG
jgi:hypothetical protein